VAEQFRSLRTNLFYLSKDFPLKTILITSFKQGEGKSFISSNLADSIAITGKKVIILDFDLRKAKLTEKLGYPLHLGISDYLTETMSVKDIIVSLDDKKQLSFIPSGILKDNPGELILSDRMKTLFEYLKEHYDYVIVDTAPVGVVSDAISIGNWADFTLFVVRHNYSLRSSMSIINNLNHDNKLPNITLVINGILNNKDYKFGGYGYGYHFNTYNKNSSKKFKVV
jgi:capsular exopolysaccharide synthesis family protein